MSDSSLSRRTFLGGALGASASLAGMGCAGASGPAAPEDSGRRPNIVMILADDMGYSDLGCYGGEIPTPHLDRLGYGGLRFTNHHTNNMCVPTRAALMTGIHSDVSCFKGPGQTVLHPRAATVPQALRDAGYGTYMVGKWHLAGAIGDLETYPCQKGFDRYYGMLFGTAHYFQPLALVRQNQEVPEEMAAPDYYFTNAITDNAVAYIEEASAQDKPFFLYVAYTAAHWPLHAFPEDIEPHKGRYAAGWDALREQRHVRQKELGVINPDWPLSPRHAAVPAWEDEPHPEWQQRRMEVYAAQVSVMDRGVGRILDELERQGRLDNTLICFQIDNGGCHVEYTPDRTGDFLPPATKDGRPIRRGNLPDIMPGPADTFQSYGHGWANASNTPFRLFKQYDHEGGVMTPLIAHWPGVIEPGSITDQLGHVTDLAPTFLDVAGVEPPSTVDGRPALPMDGRSLAPVLRGGRREPPSALYWQWNHGRAVRQGKWKLVSADKGPWELYDMESDGTELHDLATDMPEKAAELEALWKAWKDRSQAPPSVG
ncbi:MAG: sulfatase-like hydrolase/transferase [Acidobacteria bacterium]|nr:sulfatase-like hydrolase/transferase [Acidobacteriota bacterium]